MPILQTNAVKLMELRNVKIAKLLSDITGNPFYDAMVNLTGAVKLTISPKAETKKLKGDSTTIDIYQKITEVELDVEIALLSLDGLQVIQGGTVTSSGTTPSQKTVYSLKSTDPSPGYFKIEGQWTYAGDGIGDAHVVLYKVKATDLPAIELNDSSGNFGTVKFKAIAVPALSNASWYDIVLNETLTAIAGNLQIETATIAGTITTAGNATVTVTGLGITGSPVALSVAVALNDSASVVAQKIREAIALNSPISALYSVGGSGTAVVLTARVSAVNDATLNIAFTNGTCVGLIPNATSVTTATGSL